MGNISRRQFLKGAAGLGFCAFAGGVFLSGLSRRSSGELTSAPPSPYAREALYYTGMQKAGSGCQSCHGPAEPSRVLYCHVPHSGDYVRCQLCPKGCIISEGHRGDCRVRENRGGKLYSMVYGNACAVHVDPIEKKPFFHFLPTTRAFSIATAGCNLHCLFCQNWTISQFPPEETDNVDLSPEQVVEYALRSKAHSIAYTYAEPTVFYEYMLATARVGRARGINSVVVTAGYMNHSPLKELCRAVDAIKIDLKGFNTDFYEDVCFATLEPVLEAMKTVYEEGVHLEIVNLVVPTLNDAEEEVRAMCRWIAENVGPDVPTHFTRFHPQYKLKNLPPTPVESLERARAIAMREGMHYVYVGNVPGHPGNHTYCHHCGEIVIRRLGFAVTDYRVLDGRCGACGNPIPGVWGQGVSTPT